MTVLTPGIDCGTPRAKDCSDDSGATAFLINGDDNDFGFNRVSGSNAFSYDNFGRDGSAFEIFMGSRNVIHDNVSIDNFALSELGTDRRHKADGNVLRNNTVTATCGADCTFAFGITLRGPKDAFGPNRATVIENNTFHLPGGRSEGITCFASCPPSTVMIDNTISARRGIWVDGSGWTLRGIALFGRTEGRIGDRSFQIPADRRVTVAWGPTGLVMSG
jgi:hypothetical protein